MLLKKLPLLSVILLAGCSSKVTKEKTSNSQNTPEQCKMVESKNAPSKVWEATGFEKPESVVFDEKTNSYYVSNVVGVPNIKDGEGWISKLDQSGNVVAYKWTNGEKSIPLNNDALLHAPKGMRIRGNHLWLTDIDSVKAVQISTGAVSNIIPIKNAKFLNDIVFSDTSSAIYVTDMLTNKIHSIQKSPTNNELLSSNELESPNGIVTRGKKLYVASWGPEIKSDFSTSDLGKILVINEKSKKIKPWNDLRVGHLDGLEFKNETTLIVSDWKAGKV
ncbi:hypothetical protein N9N67_12570, partial [Bacteriovoracaceae bacterium]|nr:hypothetical protein [Bacteriovoracaceae bacterium]